MLTLNRHFQPHPDVVDTPLDNDETVLLHLTRSAYYTLNPTGSRIWRGLKQGWSLQDISHSLQQVFEVDAQRADRSVLALVQELSENELVQPPN
ncbi:PqqD family protein [Candidatus Entotheonella palauensis]|uniref:PqqD family protein n=1 Tax=Candidatus Entotheonella gemina TaxID=1429439 RepID=W4LPZ0_9BACT|nr:PqqD family protein [Candidatus Entotheonella palauensis]ETX00033.1 MAG: hypothetical protein ETSY2_39835 [Candidatus Entotheonella gemina]